MRSIAKVLVGLAGSLAVVASLAVSAGASTIRFEPFHGVRQFGDYGNTKTGDCSLAAAADLMQLWTHKVQNVKTIETLYREMSPNDTGVQSSNVFTVWESSGIDGVTISGVVPVANSETAVMAATSYYDGLYAIVNLPMGGIFGPDEPSNNVDSPTSFTMSPWSIGNSGTSDLQPHAVAVVGYDSRYVYLASWGAITTVTWGWFAKYEIGAYGVIR